MNFSVNEYEKLVLILQDLEQKGRTSDPKYVQLLTILRAYNEKKKQESGGFSLRQRQVLQTQMQKYHQLCHQMKLFLTDRKKKESKPQVQTNQPICEQQLVVETGKKTPTKTSIHPFFQQLPHHFFLKDEFGGDAGSILECFGKNQNWEERLSTGVKQQHLVDESENELEQLYIQAKELQMNLRKQVLNVYVEHLAQIGEPICTNPAAYSRNINLRKRKKNQNDMIVIGNHTTSAHSDEIGGLCFSNAQEREKRKKYIERQQQRQFRHQEYLHAVCLHAKEFSSYHKAMQSIALKNCKAVKSYIDSTNVKLEKQEEKHEKLRLKALKMNDMSAYSKLVKEAKNERLTYLFNQTNTYLDKIRELIRSHKRRSGASASTESVNSEKKDEEKDISDVELDFFGVIRNDDLPEQPTILVGGDLKAYQFQGLQWMLSLYDNKLNGILADEMGLGKTIQTIALLTYLMEKKANNGPFLVVVPLSTLSNWVNEFEKWAPTLVLVVYKGNPQQRKEIVLKEMQSMQFNVLLTTYEYIMKDQKQLKKIFWQYIIVDEGHRMKNAQSKFAQTLGHSYSSRNRLLLTGTPLQNSLPELWALLNFLLPTIFDSVENFEEWFSKPFASFDDQDSDSQMDRSENLTEEERMLVISRLHMVLRPFLLRRVKSSVMDQLPSKVERVLKCNLSGYQKVLYRHIQQGTLKTLSNKSSCSSSQVYRRGLSNILMQLRKVCNHPYLFTNHQYLVNFQMVRCSGKFELLDRMLPKLQRAGHRVLMFSQMTQLMHILEDYFVMRGFKYLRLDGSTSAQEREIRMFQFNQPDSPYFIFLLSTRAGGLGLNLATADTVRIDNYLYSSFWHIIISLIFLLKVIIFDSDWNPAMDAQAQDRAHRIGQKNEVRVFRLMTNSPVEEKILSRATSKMNLNNLVVEAGKFHAKSKEAERKAMLENLIKLDSLDKQKDDDEEENSLNELMAVTEQEFRLYEKMDQERIQAEGLTSPRLIEDDKDVNIPDWLLKPLTETDPNEEMLGNLFNMQKRKRKEVSYSEKLTDQQFVKMIEKDDIKDDTSHSTKKKSRKRVQV